VESYISLEMFLMKNYNVNFKNFIKAFDNTQEHDTDDIKEFIEKILPESWIEYIFEWQRNHYLATKDWATISEIWSNTCDNYQTIYFYEPKKKIKINFEEDEKDE